MLTYFARHCGCFVAGSYATRPGLNSHDEEEKRQIHAPPLSGGEELGFDRSTSWIWNHRHSAYHRRNQFTAEPAFDKVSLDPLLLFGKKVVLDVGAEHFVSRASFGHRHPLHRQPCQGVCSSITAPAWKARENIPTTKCSQQSAD